VFGNRFSSEKRLKCFEIVSTPLAVLKALEEDNTSANYIVHFVCGILLVCFDNHRKC